MPERHPRPVIPEEVYDRGLQQERTALAWDRTSLTLAVAGALFIRAGEPPYGDPRHVPGFVAILAGMLALRHSYRLYSRRHAQLREERSVVAPRAVLGLAVVAVGLGLASLVLVLTSF